MNFRDLKYVVAVAEERHFGRASLKCHISQPALSGQLRKLEEELGVVLFERTNRWVQITPIGEKIAEQARQLVALSDEIIATAQASRDPFSGSLRLGMIPTIAPYLSPLVLPEIHDNLPNLSLSLIEGQTADLETRVGDGDLDGAVVATVPNNTNLTSIPLYDEPFWIGLSKRHPLAKQLSIDILELDQAELLLLADGHCLRDQMLDVCHMTTGAANLNTRETSLETLLSLVAAEDGVTLLPALTAARIERDHDRLVARREASEKAGRTVQLIMRGSFPRKELMHRLAGIVRAQVPENLVTVLQLASSNCF